MHACRQRGDFQHGVNIIGKIYVNSLKTSSRSAMEKGHAYKYTALTYTHTHVHIYKIVIAFILRFEDKLVVGCCYSALEHLYESTKMKIDKDTKAYR